MILAALAMTGCKDRAVTLSEITEQASVDGAQGADSSASTADSNSSEASGSDLTQVTADSSSEATVANASDVSTQSDSMICVYICGCVVNPGVYELPEGSRICDGLEAAGGFADGADETRINLAGFLRDGDMVFFPEVGEELPGGAAGVTQPGSAGYSNGASNYASASAQAPGLININTASEETLCSLPGIGSSKAKAIIKYREENGPFSDKTQIMNVSGIGQNLYNNIEDLICV